MNNNNKLEIWVIYDHPIDYSDCFVARKFLNNKPTLETIKSKSLESIRQQLRDRGLMQLPRDEGDGIFSMVEYWL